MFVVVVLFVPGLVVMVVGSVVVTVFVGVGVGDGADYKY